MSLNNTNSSTDFVNDTDRQASTITESYLSTSCGILSLSLNFLVLFIAFRYLNIGNRLNQVFVVSMSIADFLWALVYLLPRPLIPYLPLTWCWLYNITIWLCSMSSTLFLLLLNIDKFISIRWPLQYNSYVTERSVAVQTIVVWTFTTTVAILQFVTPLRETYESKDQTCAASRFSAAYDAVRILVFFGLPITISLAISAYIFYVAQTATREPIGIDNKRSRQKKLFKRILFVFSSTLWTSCTTLPYRLALCGYYFCLYNSKIKGLHGEGTDKCAPKTFQDAMQAFLVLIMLGTIGNPIITLVTQKIYRLRIVYLLAKISRLCLCGYSFLNEPSSRRMNETEDFTESSRNHQPLTEHPLHRRHRLHSDSDQQAANVFDVI